MEIYLVDILNNAIVCDNTWGPTFGGSNGVASDIYINDKSNTNLCHSNLGNSYVHPNYSYGSNKAQSFLAGSYKFKVAEIEVYTKY